MTAPVRFRIYAGRKPSGFYAVCQVWPTFRAFDRNGRSKRHRCGPKTMATCTEVTVLNFDQGAQRTKPIFAELNFVRGHLTMEIVTHELFHATMAWGRRIGFDWARLGADDCVNQDEERITYVHGWLCRQFVARATTLGLYSEKTTVEVAA